MKILVIGPSWVGDMMMSQSLYRTLKTRYPEAIIDVMAPAWCRPLLSRMPEVNEALAMPLGHGALALGERRQIGRSLRSSHYDQAYVLPNSFKSALVPFFAGIKTRTGWRGEMRYGVLNDARTLNKTDFPLMVERYVALAYDAGTIASAADLPQPLLWPKLSVSESEKTETAGLFSLPGDRPVVGFCPGAEFGPAKRWPHYHYAVLAQKLIARGYRVVLFGSEKITMSGKISATVWMTMTMPAAIIWPEKPAWNRRWCCWQDARRLSVMIPGLCTLPRRLTGHWSRYMAPAAPILRLRYQIKHG
ncbi:ADP-heptose--LPS heptosyltransferase 2 [Tatumella ptyseos]|uniref:lipopolysaccharide heptosyltransferase II n=1 Tax=Tatumella ptyseos TaxID=82987 RepID=A0A2X5PWC6_9GAMM|nr:ADP-heptose--LPS heptosyltransferase 2 [Tatumella ptyseos]